MKKKVMRAIALVICMALVFSMSTTVFATNGNNNNRHGQIQYFKDVPRGHWAYDQIMWMLENKIIEGIGNDMFGPNNNVTRAQFAKMMVLTLNIKLYSPGTSSFLDVGKNAWEYPYVESAKTYLTGFRTSAGDYFKPSQNAVREDMAVALVKALGYQNESVDEGILNQFADANQISANLRRYVALSVKHKLVEGFTQNGKTLFDPQGNLTRAAASTLLYRAFRNSEDKVTYDDNGSKITYDDNGYTKPTIWLAYENGKLMAHWNRIDSSKFLGYAIVISQNDSTPTYQDNGFLYYITNRNQTSAAVDNSIQYSGSCDFGRYLEPGKQYYFSISVLYNDNTITGNVERAVYYGNSGPSSFAAPNISTAIENGVLVARWNKLSNPNLQGYRIVISRNDSSPSYPENGYLYWYADKDRTYAVINNIDPYTDGDFGKYLTKGEKYYLNVTAVYNDRYMPSNTIQFTYGGTENPESYVLPVMSSSVENGRLVLRWTKIESSNLLGYRVSASKNNITPKYPDNGYLYWITDHDKNYAVIDNSTAYTNGDFGGYFVKGEHYNFAITAVYKDRNITGNVITCNYNGDDNPALFPAPTVSAAYENGHLIVKWNRIDSACLSEYKVVISKNNSSPAYPANGFYGVYDKNTTSAALSTTVNYTNGDFKNLTDGTEYYFNVTAVYSNGKYVAGNAVKKLFLLPPK
ncbi:MAG TPA: S-layer homology domain-containing protein [Clostridia bacterium]|nr:S-layer homology domain-containing protein [Clostridia bacterium]